ncbi:MAG: UPF0104 family protein [Clostridiaceae bacterium]|nr:UPF0104 family protein [Clostridiaceae bacterium]
MRLSIDKIRLIFARYNRLIRVIVILLVMALVVFFAFKQFSDISLEELERAADELSLPGLALVGLIGLGSFLFTAGYDLVEDHYHPSGLSKIRLLFIGWTSQSFGRFLSSGGLSGGALRIKLYKRYESSRDNAVSYGARIWAAGLTGLCALIWLSLPFAIGHLDRLILILAALFSLYLPFYYLTGYIKIGKLNIKDSPIGKMPLREKVYLNLASIMDWLAAFIFFAYAISLFSPLISIPLLLFIYTASTAVGYLSFIPSGLGSFDLVAISLLSVSGMVTERVMLSLMLFRAFLYIVPFVIFMALLGCNCILRFFCRKKEILGDEDA